MANPTDRRPHALYRFYDTTGQLLYVGITMDPGQRWRAHRDEKPWWHEVANITVETHPSRAAVLEAERQAIIAEQPLHNVVHNRGTKAEPRTVAQLDRLAPFQIGDWVALGLRDGRCPVGEIAAMDDVWVSLRLKDFWDGVISHHAVAVRWDEIERVELAYSEDASTDPDSTDDWLRETNHSGVRHMDDQHLGVFQTAWERVHLGDTKDPVDQAASVVRQENYQRREGRP